MIARLKGLIDEFSEDHVVLDVGGVGYLVLCSARTLRELPGIGKSVVLEIETHVREDHIHLYGFLGSDERNLFKLLQTVQGVGARVALGILSAVPVSDFSNAVFAQDYVPLTQANGVGPKLAKRIIIELKDKAPTSNLSIGSSDLLMEGQKGEGPQGDAVSALVNLGYGRSEAVVAVAKVANNADEGVSIETLITAGLKELAS